MNLAPQTSPAEATLPRTLAASRDYIAALTRPTSTPLAKKPPLGASATDRRLLCLALALASLAATGCDRNSEQEEVAVPVVRADIMPSQGAASVPAPSADRQALRVGGNTTATVTKVGQHYKSGGSSVTTPLPNGYPAPTPPDAIELKWYPSVRRAEIAGEAGIAPEQGRNQTFLPLFRHIESKNIEMTSPVEIDYRGDSFDRPRTDGKDVEDAWPDRNASSTVTTREGSDWSMAFIYRSPSNGPMGLAPEGIRIYDTESVTVLSIGQRGPYTSSKRREGLARLQEWVAEHPQWTITGSPRTLYYNDPMVAPWAKWSETQVPVTKVMP